MSKSSVDITALAAALVACVAGLLLIPAGFTWLTSILGLTLFITLLSYDQEGYRTLLQSLGFAGVSAFCFTVAAILPYQYVYGLPNAQEPVLVSRWLPLTWAFAVVLIWIIDRARMGARAPGAPAGAAMVGSVFAPRAAAPPVEPAYLQPRLVREGVSIGSTPPPTAPPAPDPFASTPSVSPAAPVAPSAAPKPAQQPANLVEIYVHLTGESLNLMRSVLAEPLGRDYYRITDTMPENETWQFTPGQVVRCKRQNLSTGKALVAVEEAPRAH